MRNKVNKTHKYLTYRWYVSIGKALIIIPTSLSNVITVISSIKLMKDESTLRLTEIIYKEGTYGYLNVFSYK